jgi:sulfopyruvate decarboxylase TPP-binding subunit
MENAMIPGDQAVGVFQRLGVSHIVWIPDSEVGVWDQALTAASSLRLIRATREGEAIAIAAGLQLGGARPLVIIQCTGFFEAGDSLRNFVHDLKLPLAFLIGLRSYTAHKAGRTTDTCPVFTEPILQAWRLPYQILEKDFSADQLHDALNKVYSSEKAGVVVLGE